ncbi:MAG: 3'-5' exonuclease [Lachnospiraceae bacterium]|nr:3'-5' exonuclease [Lachnospiraceae bacterium]
MNYIALDLETTGLNPKRDRIIEIGAIRVENGQENAEFSTFVNPGRVLDERVSELTGIGDEDLKKAPKAEEIIGDLLDFIGDLPLLGHSILFDYSFVKHAAVNTGLTFEKEGIDTLRIARACHPELESKRLLDMCRYYGIELAAHRASNDARAAHLLFTKLENGFSTKYPELFTPTPLVCQVKRESPIRPQQKDKLKDFIKRHNIDCPYDIDALSRNEATRYYDKLRAQYGKK